MEAPCPGRQLSALGAHTQVPFQTQPSPTDLNTYTILIHHPAATARQQVYNRYLHIAQDPAAPSLSKANFVPISDNIIWLLGGIEPGFPRQGLVVLTTMPPTPAIHQLQVFIKYITKAQDLSRIHRAPQSPCNPFCAAPSSPGIKPDQCT